jgi:[ribosomal protein S5]-alanine N-acetyltransferase
MPLQLIPLDFANLARLERNAQANLNKGSVESQEFHNLIVEILAHSRQLQESNHAAPPWIGYLAFDPEMSGLVGTCSFKAPPTEDGVVELAYFTFPQFEGCGYATAMAGELTSVAMHHPGIRVVVAQTLEQEDGSTRVLRKLGFENMGPVQDPEDGLVWRWELKQDEGC